MATRDEKIVQYLWEAHAMEEALARNLQAHIGVTPRGQYRNALEKHLGETKAQAKAIRDRLNELGEGRNPLSLGLGLAQTVTAQVLALTKGPLDLLRGHSNEERLLKNAKDETATEALEIATYDALEQLAKRLEDRTTAQLARKHRGQEERMLARLRELIPELTDDVIRRELEGIDRYDETTIGAVDAARKTGRAARGRAKRSASQARSTAKRSAEKARSQAEAGAKEAADAARRVPGVAQAEGEARGLVADEEDLPIPNYDSLSADEIVKKLRELPQRELAMIDGYERKSANRKSVLDRAAELRGEEPWPGYDEMTVNEMRKRINATDDAETLARVRDYERAHKERKSVIDAASKSLTPSPPS
jgi:ferritin-like metal-binding protein YciE